VLKNPNVWGCAYVTRATYHYVVYGARHTSTKSVREGHVSWGQPRLPSQESGVSAPPPHFWGFLYLCLHCLTQNDQIRHGKAYGEVTKYVRDYPIFFNLALHLTGGRVINADPELSCRPLVTHWSLTGHPWSLTGVFVPFGFRG